MVNESFNFARGNTKAIKKTTQPLRLLKDPALYEFKKSFEPHTDEVTCLEMLQNGNFISGSLDSSIALWDPSKMQILKRYEGHTNSITQAIELANGNIATASLDGSINVWDR